jgi:sarcosine oxidase/sarcosine oxidase subunit beta
MNKPKVIIVGAGINGLATAWALLRRGYQVEVFDKGAIPNPVASSYDEHRIIRRHYGDLQLYADRMPEAFRLWEDMFADIGARHFDPLPQLLLERGESGWVSPSIAHLDTIGIGWREIPLEGIARDYPMIRTDGLTRAVEFSGGGALFPIRILTDLVVHLAARGVVFRQGTEVTSVDLEAGRLVANGKAWSADHIVIAAGAWVTRLLPELAPILVPSRQAVMFLAPPPALAPLWRAAPLILDLGEHSSCYVLPPRPGTRLKIGDHVFTRQGDPDASRTATDADVDRLMTAGRLAYADFDSYTVLERKACYYTVTENEHFVIRSMGRRGTVISACSGHGFKLAPVSGEEAASLVSESG